MNEEVVREEINKRVKGTQLEGTELIERFIKETSKQERLDLHGLTASINSLFGIAPRGVSKSQLQNELSPKNLLYSHFWLDRLSPSVEAIRYKLFRSKEAPFRTIEEATRWIEQEDQKKPSEGTLKEANELRRRLQEMTHWNVSLEVLPYIGGDGRISKITAWVGTLLEPLAYETKRMARAIGFSQASLVMHILTGIKPLFPLARIIDHRSRYNAPSGETFMTHNVELNITARDLSTSQLSQLYKEMRGKLKVVSDRHIDEDDWKLYEIIKKLGYPPKKEKGRKRTGNKRAKGTVAFWRMVQQEWEQEGKQAGKPNKRTTWNAYKRAYDRLIDRLEDTGRK